MSEKPPYKRRAVFVQRAFQGRFIGWMLLMIVAFAVCSAAILYVLLASDLESETRAAHLRIADTWQKLGLSIILGNAVSALFTGLSVIVVVLYISHKIAGPMYRFQNLFREIGRGNLEVTATLREKDQLQELAHSLDEMVASLKQRRDERRAVIDKSRSILDRLRESADGTTPPPALLDELSQQLETLSEHE